MLQRLRYRAEGLIGSLFLVITSLEGVRIVYNGKLRANAREKVKTSSISPEVGE